MFAGHYAPAFALKRAFPEVPLWSTFVAVQAVDVLFFALVPLGIEKMAVDPARPGLLAMVLQYMPYSHSLLATLCFGAAILAIGWNRTAICLALAVESHWLLDLVVHTPDLPLALGNGPKVGLGLWNHQGAAWALEVALLGVGVWLARPKDWRMWALAGLLAVVQTVLVWVMPPPPSVLALAAMSQASYVGFALLARRADP